MLHPNGSFLKNIIENVNLKKSTDSMNISVVNRWFKFVSGSIKCMNICVQAVISDDEEDQQKIVLDCQTFLKLVQIFSQ